MQICVSIDFKVTHVFRKDNSCVDKLTNLSIKIGLSLFGILFYLSALG